MKSCGLVAALVLLVAGSVLVQGQGLAGHNSFIPQQSPNCNKQFACVTWDLCHNGEVNTDGRGKLDVRTPPPIPGDLSHLVCLEGPSRICCRIPDAIWIEHGGIIEVDTNVVSPHGGTRTEVWQGECNIHHACVPSFHCRDGVINTSGAGLLDPRIRPTKCIIKDPEYLNEEGVCCRFPEPVPQLACSHGQLCVPDISCASTIPTGSDGFPTNCYLDTVTGDVGVCCIPPLEPPVTSCTNDGSFFCANTGICLGQTLTDPYGRELSCYVGGTSSLGQCCEAPLPVDSCSIGGTKDICVAKNACFGSIIVNNYLDEKTCYLGKNVGVCCSPPAALQTCKSEFSCTNPELCDGDFVTIASYPDCYISNSSVGKCCEPKLLPVIIIDTCPGEAVCLPEFLCISGDILDTHDAYQPSTSVGEWQRCQISGTGLVSSGVCCRNPTVKEELPPPATQCGVRNLGLDTRISNTDPVNYQAQFGEFPWQAIIFFTNFTFKCGASLITDEWLLTAAHCVAGYTPHDLRVRLGEWKVDSYEEAGQYLDVHIQSVTIHPEYNHTAENLHNDIALLRLSQPINFQYHINQVCVPNPGQVFYGQTRCFATGWGKDAFDGGIYQSIMKKVDLPLVPRDQCVAILRKTRLGKHYRLHESFLCAGGEIGKDACEGDGGGPLVCQDPHTGNYVIAGITAWGIGCGNQIPGVYVDVEYFREWIDFIVIGAQGQQQQQSGISYGKK